MTNFASNELDQQLWRAILCTYVEFERYLSRPNLSHKNWQKVYFNRLFFIWDVENGDSMPSNPNVFCWSSNTRKNGTRPLRSSLFRTEKYKQSNKRKTVLLPTQTALHVYVLGILVEPLWGQLASTVLC